MFFDFLLVQSGEEVAGLLAPLLLLDFNRLLDLHLDLHDVLCGKIVAVLEAPLRVPRQTTEDLGAWLLVIHSDTH